MFYLGESVILCISKLYTDNADMDTDKRKGILAIIRSGGKETVQRKIKKIVDQKE